MITQKHDHDIDFYLGIDPDIINDKKKEDVYNKRYSTAPFYFTQGIIFGMLIGFAAGFWFK